MEKYLNNVIGLAKNFGMITDFHMDRADKFFPARFEAKGITLEGKPFEIDVRVGEKLHEDS